MFELSVSSQANHSNLDEELTYDYKFEREIGSLDRIPCLCGTAACKGFLNWYPPCLQRIIWSIPLLLGQWTMRYRSWSIKPAEGGQKPNAEHLAQSLIRYFDYLLSSSTIVFSILFVVLFAITLQLCDGIMRGLVNGREDFYFYFTRKEKSNNGASGLTAECDTTGCNYNTWKKGTWILCVRVHRGQWFSLAVVELLWLLEGQNSGKGPWVRWRLLDIRCLPPALLHFVGG